MSGHGSRNDACEELTFIVSYLAHNDQDANHAWVVRRIRAVLAGKDPCKEPIASFEEATMDHVKKASKGGLFEESNLRPAHAVCNNQRHQKKQRVETPRSEKGATDK